MSRTAVIEQIEQEYMKKDVPSFRIGDTVRVDTKIVEGGKERMQAFTGVVIAKDGKGISETFTVYRTAYGSSMERVFLIHSPRITQITVMRSSKVRRAKLYYLRGKSGKKARLRERFFGSKEKAALAEAKKSEESDS